jgi:hypothetical protein
MRRPVRLISIEISRKISLPILFVVILACALPSWAQFGGLGAHPRQVDASNLGSRVLLGPDWLFSAGDNAEYASPEFDDAHWKTISAGTPLGSYELGDVRFAWYRIHVHVNPELRNLVVEAQDVEGGCEIFANGIRIGGIGSMQSHYVQDDLTFYDIPNGTIEPDGALVIAIRLALTKSGPRGTSGARGSGPSIPLHADSVMLATRDSAERDASYAAAHQTVVPLMLSGLGLIVGMVALALYLAMRERTEYAAIAVSLLAGGFQLAEIVWYRLHGQTVRAFFFDTLWLGISNVALVEFVRLILHLRRARWLLGLEITMFLGFFVLNLGELVHFSLYLLFAGYFLPSLIVLTALSFLLLRGLLRGNRDARVVLPAIAVVSLGNYWNTIAITGVIWHLPFHIPRLPTFHFGTYQVIFWDVWDAIYFVTMLLFLVLRTIGIARKHARVAAELEAARVVQHVLIPDAIPAIPGFSLESVYKPAGEVGGDFFQISPIAAGGVLAIIGDVSGKGMPAAMTVSLLVGTFRTLAHYTQSPGEILRAMNQRMLARSAGGFTTCLVVRIDPDGTLTAANAGHLAPYADGKEVAVEAGLPLGLAAQSEYPETRLHLPPGTRLTLVTDGVVEARNSAGELFGFERTAKLSTHPAEQVVAAAQSFGQEDDITVLTLRCEPAEVLHA